MSDAHRDSWTGRTPRIQNIEIGGKPYVILPKADYDRLCIRGASEREDASAFAPESVGADLRARRHQARMTLAEVALRADIAPETLSRIENARTNPTMATVRSVLRALGEGRA